MIDAQGTFECPICGKEYQHYHSPSDAIRWHQQYRSIFERNVFQRIRRTHPTYHTYAVDSVEITGICYKLGSEGDYARGKNEWAQLSKDHDGYVRPWMQTLWELFKAGVIAAAPPAPDTITPWEERKYVGGLVRNNEECMFEEINKLRAAIAAAPSAPSVSADARDGERLDYVLTNRNHRVRGSDAKGWCVLDCSNGLEFIVRHAQTARAAIDAAIAAQSKGASE